MKKQIFPILMAIGLSTAATAQQESQFTQFMYNKMAYNPGSAGSNGVPEATVFYRNQWMGFEGAPKTQGANFQSTWLQNRVGLGANLVHRSIGIQDRMTLDAAYAYRVRAFRGTLGAGLQASVRYFRNNYLDPRLQGTQPVSTDAAVPQDAMSKILPNFGFGLYYQGEQFYLGLSAPRLVANNIDFAKAGSVLSKEVQHFYLMSGYKWAVAEGVELTPQFLFKYVKNAPLDGDFNLNATLNERFIAGLTYRLGGGQVSSAGESIDLLAGVQATPKIFVALSYDIGMTQLRKYHNGSVELVARYFFREPTKTGWLQGPEELI